VASTLDLPRNGVVGFIDWLDDSRSPQRRCDAKSSEQKTHETERQTRDDERDDAQPRANAANCKKYGGDI